MSLVPLMLLWLWWRDGAAPMAPTAPSWPTPASPPPSPPPLPAFQTQPAPVHATADTATPLADLHHAPPKPPPIKHPVTPVQKAIKTATTAKSAAKRAANLLHVSLKSSAPAQRTAAVTDLQAILISRGANLKRDGLYGPKTASAWGSLARSKGLPATISRVGPKSARVVTQTFDALSVPPIP
jgi:hypothetical protein